jgi:hypothetical protein
VALYVTLGVPYETWEGAISVTVIEIVAEVLVPPGVIALTV